MSEADPDPTNQIIPCRHWVEDLFPPSFTLSDDDVEQDGNQTNAAKIQKGNKGGEERVHVEFQQQSQDSVYERVLRMLKFDKQVREAMSDSEQQVVKADPTPSKTIWNQEEIATLRETSTQLKDENRKLKTQLKACQQQNDRLKSRLTKVETSSHSRLKHMDDVEKANDRLKIHSVTIQAELDRTISKVNLLQNCLKDANTERLDLLKLYQNTKTDLNKVTLGRNRLETQLQRQRDEFESEMFREVENAKIKLSRKVDALERKLSEQNVQIDHDQHEHVMTCKALDHLRSHFASLPLNDVLPSDLQANDQLKSVSYL